MKSAKTELKSICLVFMNKIDEFIIKELAFHFNYIARDGENVALSTRPIKFKRPSIVMFDNSAIMPIGDNLKCLENHKLYSLEELYNGIRKNNKKRVKVE